MIYSLILYNFVLLASTGFVYLSEKGKTNIQRNSCIFVAFLIVVLPTAIRYRLGRDYINYENIFYSISHGGGFHYEWGYYYLNLWVSKLGLGVDWVFAIAAIFTYIFIFLSYPKKYRTLFHFIFIIVFFFDIYNLVRNMMAIAVVLFAVMKYKEDQKVWHYLAYVLFAALFHISAIIMIILPVFNNRWIIHGVRRCSVIFIPILLVLSLILFAHRQQAILFVFHSGVLKFINAQHYLDSGFVDKRTEIGTGLGVIVKLIILIVPVIFVRNIIKSDSKNSIFLIICYGYLFSYMLSLQLNLFGRLSHWFQIAFVLIPLFIAKCEIPKLVLGHLPLRPFLLTGMIVFWFLNFNQVIIRSDVNSCDHAKIQPYVSIFNKQDSKRGICHE